MDWNPISAVVNTVGTLITKYIPSEADRMKFQAELAAETDKHQERMEELATEDRNSARTMQIATKSLIPAFLAIAITSGFFGILAYMLRYSPPPETKDILNIMLGALGTAWIAVVNFYFGSSADSHRKTELMGQKSS